MKAIDLKTAYAQASEEAWDELFKIQNEALSIVEKSKAVRVTI